MELGSARNTRLHRDELGYFLRHVLAYPERRQHPDRGPNGPAPFEAWGATPDQSRPTSKPESTTKRQAAPMTPSIKGPAMLQTNSKSLVVEGICAAKCGQRDISQGQINE